MDYRQTLQSGTVLDGKYRIDRIIGAGGFGITYEAFDVRLAATVAIKEYFPSQFGFRDATYSVRPRSDGDRDIFERLRTSFLREARTLNQFDHPAIVRVLNVFEAYGTAYMVMKYETGPSLKAWLASLGRPPTQEELDRLTVPLLDALETMHMAAFLHRDIAPDNIIVRRDGSPVLLDFGASRRVMGEMSGTLTGVVKKGYSPQEQYAADGRSQGPWTDIYALGATLYRCVSGETPEEATQRMLDDRVVPAVAAGGDRYRQAFLAAIDAAMVLRPEARPQSIAEWRRMLFEGMALFSGQPQSWPFVDGIATAPNDARPMSPAGGAATPRSEPIRDVVAQDAAPGAATAPAAPRRKTTAMVIAAAVIALIGGGAMLLASDQLGLMRATSVQPPTRPEAGPATPKRDDTRLAQDAEIQRLAREAAERAAVETRRRLEEDARQREAEEARRRQLAEEAEARQRAAEEARRREVEEARLRQLAEEMEARRKAEEAHRRAVEEAQQRAAEEARQRKLVEEAVAARRAAEEAQRRQEQQIERLTREAAERAAAETRRQIEEERKRLLAEAEARERKLAAEVEAARKSAEAARPATATEPEKEAREPAKIASLPKPPQAAPSNNGFDGTWRISFTALAASCKLRQGNFVVTVSQQQVTAKTSRGNGSGRVNPNGSIHWVGPATVGNWVVDWTGTLRGESGTGNYAVRGGSCNGRFMARRD